MSRRSKIIIAVVVILLILLAVLLLLQQPTPAPQQPQNQAPQANANAPLSTGGLLNTSVSANVAPQPTNTTLPPASQPVADDEGNVIRLAAAFAERYGSFSNQTSYENLLELRPLMTASFAASTDAYVEAQRSSSTGPAAEYFGITTRAINTTVASFDDGAGQARLVVKGQRREISAANPEGRVYYQDIALQFLKQGDEWKVDSASWQEQGTP